MRTKPLLIPALRGVMGEWAYYSCLMSFRELARRVDYATAIHKNKQLSDMIQRTLEEGRTLEVATYLQTVGQRFFNSLVIAVYGGDPGWHPVSRLKPLHSGVKTAPLIEGEGESLGLLGLSGREKLFAIDGQHRLAGIKRAVAADSSLGDDQVSLIFVGHKKSPEGMERTRRLFTTLNKRAKPVSKAEIIALDEDDVMAITLRDLVETHKWFKGDRISIQPKQNLPAGDITSLTTIVNLYDVFFVLFNKMHERRSADQLKYYRPSESVIAGHRDFALSVFQAFAKHVSPLGQFFRAKDYRKVVAKYRRSGGGHVLFRPVGLKLVVEALAQIEPGSGLDAAVARIGKLPLSLDHPPFVRVLWDPVKRRMINGGQGLARDLVLYMLRHKQNERSLAKRYGVALEQPGQGKHLLAELPRV